MSSTPSPSAVATTTTRKKVLVRRPRKEGSDPAGEGGALVPPRPEEEEDDEDQGGEAGTRNRNVSFSSSSSEEEDALVSSSSSSDGEAGGPAAGQQLLLLPAASTSAATTTTEPYPTLRHRCLHAGTPGERVDDDDDPSCQTEMPMDKVKMHYVVHYTKRGAFDKMVTWETKERRRRIEAYECNICGAKFKNNLAKKDFPARGSIIYHLASDHGKLLDVMRSDESVDMREVIDLLAQTDPKFQTFVEEGTGTDFDDDLVTIKKSSLWKLKKMNSSTSDEPSEGENSPKVTEEPPQTFVDASSSTKPDPDLFECPKCEESQGNRNPSFLKLHLFQHYSHTWEAEVDKLWQQQRDSSSSTPLELWCSKCEKRRKFTGVSESGLRKSIMCHWAIQHQELKSVLEMDETIDRAFLERLYDNREYRPPLIVHRPKKKKRREDEEEEEEDAMSSSESDSDEMPLERRKRPDAYVMERSKINFFIDDLDNDSDEWRSDGSGEKFGSRRKKGSKRKILPKRELPKRASAPKMFAYDDDDDE